MAKVGDLVRYLNSVGGGRIIRIEGQIAYVEEDGFENPILLRECVVVTPGATHVPEVKPQFGKDKTSSSAPTPAPSKEAKPKPAETFVVEETPGGERLNIVLGYEAEDLKRLSSTTYFAYLVNDSNYYLNFTYMTRSKESQEWTLRYVGIVEPGIQILLGEVERDDINEMDHVAIQYIAYKQSKPFTAKAPTLVDIKLDNTKFFKLHCFQPNMYFDVPVIAVPIVTDDKPAKQVEVKPQDIEKSIKQKIHLDRPEKKPVKHNKRHDDGVQVVDLHIHELVDNTRGLSNADMLNLQIDTFRKVMDQNLNNHGKKIVFIHGKGNGVLRQAIVKELNYRYKEHQAQDASFQEYGFGATQVTIR